MWRYLADNVYPLLRRSEITFIYDINGVSAGLIPVGSSSETVNNQSNTTGKVPGWAITVMAFLAAAAVVFGVLYARERKRTRDLINNNKDNLQVENVHVDIPEPHEEPVIFPSQEAPMMPLAASAMA